MSDELVTAIMPTRDRRELAPKSVQCFLNQTYEEKELLILDDRDCPSFPPGSESLKWLLSHKNIQLWWAEERMSIGWKRNWLCEKAWGSVICHFDSDDWHHPERLTEHLETLERSGKAVTAFWEMVFFIENRGACVRQTPQNHLDEAALQAGEHFQGSSLCYKRWWWMMHPFPDRQKLEDIEFGTKAKMLNQMCCSQGRNKIVMRVHADNTCTRNPFVYDLDARSHPGLYLKLGLASMVTGMSFEELFIEAGVNERVPLTEVQKLVPAEFF